MTVKHLCNIKSYVSDATYFMKTTSPSLSPGVKSAIMPYYILNRNNILQFSVQSCYGAKVYVLSNLWSFYAYLLVIGDNKGSEISIRYETHADPVYAKSIPALLSCTGSRSFWVKVVDGVVELGRGAYPGDKIFEWSDDLQVGHVDGFSVGVGLDPGTALWQIPRAQGKLLSLNINNNTIVLLLVRILLCLIM